MIRTIACANPLWRAPRIHGELRKLGIEGSERTVSRVLRTVKRPPSQTWKTFLQNHIGEIVAIDFFTVPTIRLRVLFVFLVLEHQRRKVLHFGVTEHPSAEWAAQQVVEAFAEQAPGGTWSATAMRPTATSFASNQVVGHEGGYQRAPESLAECIRGADDRLDST